VKHHHRLGTPLDPGLEVMTGNYVLQQEVKQGLGLRLFSAQYLRNKFAVEEKASLSRDRVDTYQGMDSINWFLSYPTTSSASMVNHLRR
jgi:hypothetical protein